MRTDVATGILLRAGNASHLGSDSPKSGDFGYELLGAGVFRMAVLAALGVLATFSAPATTEAQVQRYQPRRATVSPYINLSRINNGAVPNYYSLVRPQLLQQAFEAQVQRTQRQQTGALVDLNSRLEQRVEPVAPTGTASWFLTPGSRQTFLDTTGYYPQAAPPTRLR